MFRRLHRKNVTTFVLGMTGVALYPLPVHFVPLARRIKALPEILVAEPLAGAPPPAESLPFLQPAPGHGIDEVTGIRTEGNPAGMLQLFQPRDGPKQFHAVVGSPCKSPAQFPAVRSELEDDSIAARSRIAAAGAVAEDLHLLQGHGCSPNQVTSRGIWSPASTREWQARTLQVMALEEIVLVLEESELPPRVSTLIEDAERRLDHLFDTNRNRRVPRFLPSDPVLLYRVLRFLSEEDLPAGRTFCEWGSGFGVGACLASLLGYQAYGLEIEEDLVVLARQLAGDHGITVENLCTSYFPEGYGSYPAQGGEELMIPQPDSRWENATVAVPAYEGMDCEVDEIDVFYVYPWPGEQELMHNLFETVAADGAILIAYYGNKDIAAYRKSIGDDWR